MPRKDTEIKFHACIIQTIFYFMLTEREGWAPRPTDWLTGRRRICKTVACPRGQPAAAAVAGHFRPAAAIAACLPPPAVVFHFRLATACSFPPAVVVPRQLFPCAICRVTECKFGLSSLLLHQISFCCCYLLHYSTVQHKIRHSNRNYLYNTVHCPKSDG
jgi:hypothetical protein